MQQKRYGEHLTQLTRWWMMNCFLVQEEDGYTLVDTTMPGAADDILKAAGNTPIKRVILTHAHMDHVGAWDALRDRLPDAEFLASARTARFLQGDLSLDEHEPQAKLRGGYRQVKSQPDRTLDPGEMVGSLEVVAAPGHTPGQIALLDTRDRTLIVGDAFSTLGGTAVSGKVQMLFPLPAMATWHKPTALDTARKLTGAEPTRLAVGHGRTLENPVPEMEKAVRAAERAFKA